MPDIMGTSARDTLNGTTANDTLSAGDGSDRVFAGPGDDVVYGHSALDSQGGGSQIDVARIAAGLSGPVFAASPPGDPDHLFVVEQHTGRIVILDANTGQVTSQALPHLPDSSLAPGGEQGLLGLAFSPDYATDGLFYVDLTNAAGDTEVRQYHRLDATHADAGSVRLVLTVDQPF